jgi:hypothetical protein
MVTEAALVRGPLVPAARATHLQRRCGDLQRSTTATWRRAQAVRGTHSVPK